MPEITWKALAPCLLVPFLWFQLKSPVWLRVSGSVCRALASVTVSPQSPHTRYTGRLCWEAPHSLSRDTHPTLHTFRSLTSRLAPALAAPGETLPKLFFKQTQIKSVTCSVQNQNTRNSNEQGNCCM